MERKRIFLCLAHMSETGLEQKYIQEAFDTNWVVPLGPNVNAFEKDLEDFVTRCKMEDGRRKSAAALENKRVVALSAGTAAVHLALIACGVGPGDEVCVQSFTFCASSHPITYLGATPVFIDSEPETWNMDPALLEEAIKDRIAKTGKKPKAIVPVALYGMPYQIDRIMEIANRYEIPVIEDVASGLGSRYKGQMLGTFGKYGVLSFNGNKMITTSGGGALITPDEDSWREIMMYATQYRESYPYYQHEKIGYNYRMSNICAGIGRGQMTVVADHIAHHKHVQELYEELLKDVKGITVHCQPSCHLDQTQCVERSLDSARDDNKGAQEDNKADVISTVVERSLDGAQEDNKGAREDNKADVISTVVERSLDGAQDDIPVYDSNYWLCTITLDPDLKVKGQENAYKTIVTGAVGGAAGVIHAASSAVTDCQPNDNVEAMRVALDQAGIEARPVWKPMHKQPVYLRGKRDEVRRKMDDGRCDYTIVTSESSVSYINGVSEDIFKVGMCLPAGPYVSDDDVKYIVDTIKSAIEK